MSNLANENFGGAFITPSARPSIHRHRDCPCFGDSTMGTHGLKSRPNTGDGRTGPQDRSGPSQASPSSNPAQGYDEVDNVMSKFRCPTPENYGANMRYNNKRHSFGSAEESDDSDLAILATSLPTYLPSYSHCSGELDYSGGSYENHQEQSFISNRSMQSNRSRSLIRENTSPNRSNGYYNRDDNNFKENRSSQYSSLMLLAFVVIAAAIAYYYVEPFNATQQKYNTSYRYDQSNFYDDLNDLGKRYGISDDSILRVQSGISTIFEKQDAGSFIFIYNSKRTGFDEEEFDTLIHDVANVAARYLRNDSTTVHHAVVDTSSLDMESHSQLMNKYREEVAKTGVMVVRELDKVPSALAMAFHYYCDEYNPLVKKSAIFFTLDIANCSSYSGSQKPTHAYIEKCLSKKWNEVPNHKIGPLLTRVVDVLVDVTLD